MLNAVKQSNLWKVYEMILKGEEVLYFKTSHRFLAVGVFDRPQVDFAPSNWLQPLEGAA